MSLHNTTNTNSITTVKNSQNYGNSLHTSQTIVNQKLILSDYSIINNNYDSTKYKLHKMKNNIRNINLNKIKHNNSCKNKKKYFNDSKNKKTNSTQTDNNRIVFTPDYNEIIPKKNNGNFFNIYNKARNPKIHTKKNILNAYSSQAQWFPRRPNKNKISTLLSNENIHLNNSMLIGNRSNYENYLNLSLTNYSTINKSKSKNKNVYKNANKKNKKNIGKFNINTNTINNSRMKDDIFNTKFVKTTKNNNYDSYEKSMSNNRDNRLLYKKESDKFNKKLANKIRLKKNINLTNDMSDKNKNKIRKNSMDKKFDNIKNIMAEQVNRLSISIDSTNYNTNENILIKKNKLFFEIIKNSLNKFVSLLDNVNKKDIIQFIYENLIEYEKNQENLIFKLLNKIENLNKKINILKNNNQNITEENTTLLDNIEKLSKKVETLSNELKNFTSQYKYNQNENENESTNKKNKNKNRTYVAKINKKNINKIYYKTNIKNTNKIRNCRDITNNNKNQNYSFNRDKIFGNLNILTNSCDYGNRFKYNNTEKENNYYGEEENSIEISSNKNFEENENINENNHQSNIESNNDIIYNENSRNNKNENEATSSSYVDTEELESIRFFDKIVMKKHSFSKNNIPTLGIKYIKKIDDDSDKNNKVVMKNKIENKNKINLKLNGYGLTNKPNQRIKEFKKVFMKNNYNKSHVIGYSSIVEIKNKKNDVKKFK